MMKKFDYKLYWDNRFWDMNYYPSVELGVIEPVIKKYMTSPKGKSVLEVGCGSGKCADFFINKEMEYTGLDISRVYKPLFESRYISRKFILADIYKWKPDKVYDFVFTYVTLQHIIPEHIKAVIEKLLKVGKYLFSVENMYFINIRNVHKKPYRNKSYQYEFNHDYEKLFGDRLLDKVIVDEYKTYRKILWVAKGKGSL